MKIGVVGAGALGLYYGAKLARDGREVCLLVRSDFDAIRRSGVEISGDTEAFKVRPSCYRDASEIGVCDWVIVSLKTTANHLLSELARPLVGPATAVLTLQNGLGNEEALARSIPQEQILGGLCFVCLNRVAPGVVRHIAGGRILMGEFNRWPEPRTHDLAGVFRRAGIPCQVTDSLERAHWLKLAWNVPFNGLGVAAAAGFESLVRGSLLPGQAIGPCLPTDKILDNPQWLDAALGLMREVLAVMTALGHSVEAGYAEAEVDRTRRMGGYLASTLIDFERRAPLEIEALFLAPQRVARAVGVVTPRLDALCQLLPELAAAKLAL